VVGGVLTPDAADASADDAVSTDGLGPAAAEAAPAPARERRTGRAYWQANGITEISLARFDAAAEAGDDGAQREAYYLLSAYHRRTRRILRSALIDRREPLAQAALRNFVVLQRPLARMHASNPGVIPVVTLLDRPARDDLARDLVVRALAESPEPQTEEALIERVIEQRVAGRVPAAVVRRGLGDLEASGHATRSKDGWTRTPRPYTESEYDARTLDGLVGPETHSALAAPAGPTSSATAPRRSWALVPRPPTSSSRQHPSCSRRDRRRPARGATPTCWGRPTPGPTSTRRSRSSAGAATARRSTSRPLAAARR
jgi:hypothetical protein